MAPSDTGCVREEVEEHITVVVEARFAAIFGVTSISKASMTVARAAAIR